MPSATVLIAQLEGDPDSLANSGVSEVSSEEWLLAAGVFVVAIILAGIVRRAVGRLLSRSGSTQVAQLAGRAAAFLVVILGFFYALSSIDVQVGPLLGGLGIVGIALAFALQEILGNFASGVLLQTRQPFRIGDQVVTNEYEGVVEDVNFRSTKLRTFDGETVYVPNSMVLQNPIINWTKTPTRRTTLEIGVAYGDDLAGVQRTLVAAVADCAAVITDEHQVDAFVYEFGESSINFAVRFWHGATIVEMWKARDQAAQAAKRALDREDYTIPFPQRTLWFGPGNTRLSLDASVSDRSSAPRSADERG